MLRCPDERRTWFQGIRPVVVYTDAAGCGHLGTVIFDGDERVGFSTHSPGWMHECGIYDLEMCDSFYGMCLADVLFPERSIIL